jgi:hypothetical protein
MSQLEALVNSYKEMVKRSRALEKQGGLSDGEKSIQHYHYGAEYASLIALEIVKNKKFTWSYGWSAIADAAKRKKKNPKNKTILLTKNPKKIF